jgi:hypothetical protein
MRGCTLVYFSSLLQLRLQEHALDSHAAQRDTHVN